MVDLVVHRYLLSFLGFLVEEAGQFSHSQYVHACNLYCLLLLDDKDDKGSRGLRNLSLKVKQIVVQNVRTTYKVVADQLVAELKAQTCGMREVEIVKNNRQPVMLHSHSYLLSPSHAAERRTKHQETSLRRSQRANRFWSHR